MRLILADTYRSKVYLKALISRFSNCLEVLQYTKHDIAGVGQKTRKIVNADIDIVKKNHPNLQQYIFDDNRSLREIAAEHSVRYEEVRVSKGICEVPAEKFSQDCNIFSGYPSEIVPKILTDSYTFFHAHGGVLPEYKGSTTNYYSMLECNIIGASLIKLSHELDSGELLRVYSEEVGMLYELDYHVDNALRAKVIIDYFTRPMVKYENEGQVGRMFYVAHPSIRRLALSANRK